MSTQEILSIWGAALASILTIIRVREFFQSRPRLSINYNFSSGPDHPSNEITIENASKTPVLISYWEVILVEKEFLGKKISTIESPEDNYGTIKIDSHSTHRFRFDGAHYFDPKIADQKCSKICLRLHLSGRSSPVDLDVYSGS